MSETEKLAKIKSLIAELDGKIAEIRQVFKDTSAKSPIFPEPYSEMLTISDEGTYWQIRPRQFLDSNDFSEVLRIVKQYQGEYVSAGKSSHFRVPK